MLSKRKAQDKPFFRVIRRILLPISLAVPLLLEDAGKRPELTARGAKMNILIVDEAPLMRSVLRKIMEDAGHTIVGEAADGEQAVTAYKRCLPEVVTMNLSLPVMDGITATRKIREYDRKAKVLVTATMNQAVLIKEALHAGAYDFVMKPVDRSRLLSILAVAGTN